MSMRMADALRADLAEMSALVDARVEADGILLAEPSRKVDEGVSG